MKFVDPTGREVEYHSMADRFFVFLERIFNSSFRKMFSILKKSEEKYVFYKTEDITNELCTNGESLFICYSINEQLREKDGQTIFTFLRHETTHALQFELGKFGFVSNGNGEWVANNFDLMDEMEAQDNQNYGFKWNTKLNSWRENWTALKTKEQKIETLKNTGSYKNLPEESLYNMNTERIKNNKVYARPYQTMQNRSGLCYILNNIFTNIPEEKPKFNPCILILKNDTVYSYTLIINEKDSSIESAKISLTYIRYSTKKWVGFDNDGYIFIDKFIRLKKHSTYYKLFSKHFFIPDAEMITKKSVMYNKNADIERFYIRLFCGCSYSSSTLRRSLHKKQKDMKMINDIVHRFNLFEE